MLPVEGGMLSRPTPLPSERRDPAGPRKHGTPQVAFLRRGSVIAPDNDGKGGTEKQGRQRCSVRSLLCDRGTRGAKGENDRSPASVDGKGISGSRCLWHNGCFPGGLLKGTA